jgi:secreted trypsin-like serine protease
MRLGPVYLAAYVAGSGISFSVSPLESFRSLFSAPSVVEETGLPVSRRRRSLSYATPCSGYDTKMPDMSSRRRRDVDDYSGDEDTYAYEIDSSLGPRQARKAAKKMMKRSRKTKKKKIKAPLNSDRTGDDERIIGGVEVSQTNMWKWIVHFPDVGCGGTIISHNWVLTGAHCCLGPNVNRYRTVSKEWDTTLVAGDELEYYPVQIIRHPGYNATTFEYDFCLLRYTDDLLAPAEVEPACLPSAQLNPTAPTPANETNCFVAGWGLTDAEDLKSSAAKLQEVQVEILDVTVCNSNTSYNGTVDPSSMLCAGSMGGGIDACKGDSGGPLICINSVTDVPEIQGIVSWGEGCALENKPGVYGGVFSIIDWIYDVVDPARVVDGTGATSAHQDHYLNATGYHVDHTSNTDCGEAIIGYGSQTPISPPTDVNGTYLNGLQCTWTIRVPVGQIVQLNITSMDIENDSECKYDRLQILNGNHSVWTGRGRYNEGRQIGYDEDYFNWYEGENTIQEGLCGNISEPIQFQATGNEMTVIFMSDLDIGGSGFTATINAVGEEKRFDNNCGVNAIDGRVGNFSSPIMEAKKGSAETYPPNQDCQWTIDVGVLGNGEIVQVSFDFFDVESGGGELDQSGNPLCQYDYLKVESMDEFGGSNIVDTRTLCGNDDPGILSFTQRKIKFSFWSDASDQFRGFQLNWMVKSTIVKIYSHKDALSYTVITRPRTFDEAAADCESLEPAGEWQLTRLLTDDHSKGLVDSLKTNNIDGDFYIGLRRNTSMPRFFQWVDGKSVHGDGVYQGWANDHPLSENSCAYVSVNTPSVKGKQTSDKGKWKSAQCSEQKNYVCGKKYTAVEDCPISRLPPNTVLDVTTCQKNLPGWRNSGCALKCESGFYLKPLGENAKIPKKIRANCVKPRKLDTYAWSIKSKVNFECQQACPYPYDQDSKSIKFVERSWDTQRNSSYSYLLVVINFPTRSPVQGWTSMIKFSRNITDVTFSSKSAEFIQADVATSTVVFTSTPWNAKQTGKMFAFLIGVEQPWGTDILSDKNNLDFFQHQWNPIEDHLVDSFYIESQISQEIDLNCLNT